MILLWDVILVKSVTVALGFNYTLDDSKYFTRLLDLYKDDSSKKMALNNFWRRICFNREVMDHLLSIAVKGIDVTALQKYPKHATLLIRYL